MNKKTGAGLLGIASLGIILFSLFAPNAIQSVGRGLIITPGGGCGCPYEHCGCLQITLPPYTPPIYLTPYNTVTWPGYQTAIPAAPTSTSAALATANPTWTLEPSATVKFPNTPTARPTLTRMPTMTSRPTWTPLATPTLDLPPTATSLATFTPNPNSSPTIAPTPTIPPTPTSIPTATRTP